MQAGLRDWAASCPWSRWELQARHKRTLCEIWEEQVSLSVQACSLACGLHT